MSRTSRRTAAVILAGITVILAGYTAYRYIDGRQSVHTVVAVAGDLGDVAMLAQGLAQVDAELKRNLLISLGAALATVLCLVWSRRPASAPTG